ncbi:MAG: hypothetical protein ABIQ40_08485 [Bacteroidia bacterium]
MAAETQYTANTGCATISTANTNLDGTGTLGTVLTAASNGTLIKSVTIKAQVSTTAGMVRLFVSGGGATELIAEIEVPAVTKSATDPSFENYMEINYALKSGYILKASTVNAEAMNVIAEGLDWAYYTTSVRPESTKYTANTGLGQVSTANANLDGSGTLGTVLTAAANGTNIQTVTMKAIVNTTSGMVRLFIYNGTTNFLLAEIPVTAVTKSSVAHSFSTRVLFNGNDFALKASYLLKASTEKGETINVIAEGLDWAYPA